MKSSILKALGGKWPLYMLLITLIACSKNDSTTGGSTGTTDKCKGVVCNNGGTCENGVCKCSAGYEGVHCETLSRDKFLGTFDGVNQRKNDTGGTPSTVVISADPADETKLKVSGLLNSVSAMPYNPDPCTAYETEFKLYTNPNGPYPGYVTGRFVDGNTNKIDISWSTGSSVIHHFIGTRK